MATKRTSKNTKSGGSDTESNEERATAIGNFVISGVEYPELDKLNPYHKNPRVGNVDAVAESLSKNGQFKPIVVNRGAKTGRENEILAGNHTWLGARSLGWDAIACVFVDVGDEEATRIVLADNRTSDMGEYDDRLLASLLEELPDLTGTAYTDVDFGELLADIPTDIEVIDTFGGQKKHAVLPEDPDELKKKQGAADAEDLDEDEEAPTTRPGASTVRDKRDEEVEATSLDAKSENLEGLLRIAEPDVRFEIDKTPFDIPKLYNESIPELPKKLDTWAGPLVCEDDGETWWVYNYSSDSTKGLPWDRTILAFYVFDDRFENWWKNPDKMVSRLINSGCFTVIMPDFSVIANRPRAEQLYAVYRNQWLGRFMQECGIDVIPNFTPGQTVKDLEWSIGGIPDEPPSLAMQIQTLAAGRGTGGKGNAAADYNRNVKVMREAFDVIRPKQLLVYMSANGEETLKDLALEDFGIDVVKVPTRWYRKELSGLAETRGKRAPLKKHDLAKADEQEVQKRRKKVRKDNWKMR